VLLLLLPLPLLLLLLLYRCGDTRGDRSCAIVPR
jgi:hypothetical protein